MEPPTGADTPSRLPTARLRHKRDMCSGPPNAASSEPAAEVQYAEFRERCYQSLGLGMYMLPRDQYRLQLRCLSPSHPLQTLWTQAVVRNALHKMYGVLRSHDGGWRRSILSFLPCSWAVGIVRFATSLRQWRGVAGCCSTVSQVGGRLADG